MSLSIQPGNALSSGRRPHYLQEQLQEEYGPYFMFNIRDMASHPMLECDHKWYARGNGGEAFSVVITSHAYKQFREKVQI